MKPIDYKYIRDYATGGNDPEDDGNLLQAFIMLLEELEKRDKEMTAEFLAAIAEANIKRMLGV